MAEQLEFGLAGGRGMRNPGYGGFYAGTGTGVREKVAEVEAGAHRDVAETQAGAHKYAADRGFQAEGVRAEAHKYGSDAPLRGAEYDQSLAKAAGDMMDTAFKLPPGPEREATLAHLTTQYGKHLPEHMVAPLTAASGFRDVPEGAGAGAFRQGQARVLNAQAGILEPGVKEKVAGEHAKNFQNWLHESPYSTFDSKTGKMAFMPKDEGQARDAKAAENMAHTQGFEAAKQHFGDRQLARQWLQTQPLPDGFDSHSYLAAVASDPRAWAELMGKVKTSGVRPGPAAPRPSSFLGPTRLQGEAGAPAPFRAPAPPVAPTQPQGDLRGLVESME